ncbi:M23 family metallopeptidase [Bifidobacterium sp. ESL0704]|uniref:M23 family metallopeptidase n=1 Tax=Bifidobacterium sp. ESL0704 TaxID=2983219 RepID=UPI0023FA0B84|nr:M23 family metallopeptidase [Bifidobacterium sp. ESL0704]WEV52201.1 M23 family metallopeptidase [Bifidobacterium sp. ESL0704]
MAMMSNRERQRRKRELVRFVRQQRRQRLIGLIWGSVTVVTVSAVLLIGFGTSGRQALAATGSMADQSVDSPAIDGETDEPPWSFSHHPLGVVEPIESSDLAVQNTKGCQADMRWPVVPHVVIRKFKAPKQAWGPGHRGVDIAAIEDTPLFAPANGFISFVGIVAGKSVVSIRHKSLTLTLEPAQTLLPIGTPVIKGMPIGTVKGVSDHCTGLCVHWGVRKSRKEYRDPQQLATKRKIVLKPVAA